MALALSFLQSAVDGTDSGSPTFAGQNLGTAASDRYIIAGIKARASGSVTLNSVTIGGVSATIVVNTVNTGGGNSSISALAIANVPTGTTGDVAISFSATALRFGIGLWRVTGISSATPTDTGTSTADDPTTTLDINAGGFAIGVAYNADTATASWTGLTEQYDEAVEGAGSRHSGASDVFATAQTGLTVTCDWSTPLTASGAFASWAPAADASRLLLLLDVGS